MRLIFGTFALLFAVAAQASDCIVELNGTWVLNPGKSLDEGGPDSESLVFNNSTSEQRYTMHFADEDGEEGELEWAVLCDGKDHPSPPAPWTDEPGRTVSLTRLGAKTELVIHKQNGVVTNTYTRVLVDDDKTLISIGRDANRKIEWVRVFDKK